MKGLIKKIPGFRWLGRKLFAPGQRFEGEEDIRRVGHRRYVGGHWDLVGQWQFGMMKSQGLRPHHCLCDIGCGSLRGGIHFINYLEPGHYLGMEKEQLLLDRGVEEELGREVLAAKRPELVASAAFEFDRFSAQPDYALAVSLFTHLPAELVEMCLRNLRRAIKPEGIFIATFFVVGTTHRERDEGLDYGHFEYAVEEMEALGRSTGWRAEFLGDGGHPRSQLLMKYTPDVAQAPVGA